jgi:hypothetical protein
MNLTSRPLIVVDRSKPFEPHPFLTEDYGEFFVLKEHPLSKKITTFDIEEDIILIGHGNKRKSAFELVNVIDKKEAIPVDLLSAKALWEIPEGRRILQRKWDWRLDTITFLGTILTTQHGPCPEHVVTFKYDKSELNNIRLIPFEAGDAEWGEDDPIAVFNQTSVRIKQQLER